MNFVQQFREPLHFINHDHFALLVVALGNFEKTLDIEQVEVLRAGELGVEALANLVPDFAKFGNTSAK